MKTYTLKLIFLTTFFLTLTGFLQAANFLVTNTNDSGAGSLRQAIIDSNTNDQDDVIDFDPTVFGIPQTIVLTSDRLILGPDNSLGTTKSLTINGPGAHLLTISGNNQSRVMSVQRDCRIIVSGITVSDGIAGAGEAFAVSGGGILIEGGSPGPGLDLFVLKDSIVTNNTVPFAHGSGGGIFAVGRVKLINVLIHNNHVPAFGGGLSAGISSDVTIINSTISNNSAAGLGGGISTQGATVSLINSTVAFNFGIQQGAEPRVGGIYTTSFSSIQDHLKLRNTIVAGNTVRNANTFVVTKSDVTGKIESQGYNIIGFTTGSIMTGDTTGNQLNIDPKLDQVLKTNGGLIPLHALRINSSAIDQGDNCVLMTTGNGGCVNESIINDQRGVARPQDADGNATSTVDIGAFEATANEYSLAPPVPDLNGSSDSGSSNSDNNTNLQVLSFDVTGLASLATVDLLRNGEVVSTEVDVAGGSVTITDSDAPAIGTFEYTIRQTSGGVTSLQSVALEVTVDTQAPTPVINQTSGQSDPTNSQPISFTTTFDEAVTGFNSSHVSLVNSTAGVGAAGIQTAGSGINYTVAVSNITSDGFVVADILPGSVQDIAGNSNMASTSTDNSVSFDTTPPTVTINQAIGQNDPTGGTQPVNFTVVFNEPVSNFNSADISLAGSTANVSSASIQVTGSGATYNVAVGNITSNGSFVRASVVPGGANDPAGNPNVASTSTDNTITIDNVGPSVTINQAAGQIDPTSTLPITYTVVFNESVTGFDGSDISLSDSTVVTSGLTRQVSGSGANYTVTIGGSVTSNGNVIRARVLPNSVSDALGNTNAPSTSTDNTVSIDNVAPTVTINQAAGQSDPASTQPIKFTVLFSESVTGFNSNDISLNGSTANTSSANIQVTGGGSSYTVSISNINSTGQVIANVVANAAQDAAGNVSGASTSSDNSINVIGPFRKDLLDFDGDNKTDISIFRPSLGQWWYLRSSDFGNRGFQFGISTDKIVPADYTGDGKTDIALFRPSTGEWFVLRSEDSSFYSVPFGTNGDIPAPGDFDGDGKADTAVYRPSDTFWYIQNSSGGTTFQQFGVNEDKPVVADYDGDGKDDIAVFRPSVSEWWLFRSTAGVIGYQFGSGGDKTVQGDYTGDGKADVALFRPSNGFWYILRSEDTSFYSVPFGISTDIPTAGDYDGDGKTDTAVFRPSDNFWYVQGTTSGFFQIQFGIAGDIPLPSIFSAP